jgi:hypothetical protein
MTISLISVPSLQGQRLDAMILVFISRPKPLYRLPEKIPRGVIGCNLSVTLSIVPLLL